MSTLYIVATPIGNLEDLSLRALRILKEVDFIICEDTRVTSKLLARYEISKPLVSYFQHSRLQKIEEITARLSGGQNAALVTDAGTPGISDPGGVLIKSIDEKLGNEIKIVPLPGPCAAIAALSISGFPTDKFLFLGFPPHKKGRQTYWKKVVESENTVVFYESCHRIIKSLTQLQDLLHTTNYQLQTKVVVARELTKMFESVYRGTIEEVTEKVKKDPIKGEYVVIFSK
ncbi:MAG: 16S rRNA (cytidine(1402)-2'-O)-methyltransferase [bacterium]|nr:16S rRNA (cytidine(1402)-2'-O)-methyltransferase [bacterium]